VGLWELSELTGSIYAIWNDGSTHHFHRVAQRGLTFAPRAQSWTWALPYFGGAEASWACLVPWVPQVA
jgi:hypothetical protein